MKTVIDVNNFWSPSGGGVRQYHLQKMEYYKNRQSEFKLVFLMQDDKNITEEISPTLTIEHIKAFKVPGQWWKYRFIFSPSQIRKYIEKHNPDIIEVGSPYILPAAVRKAAMGVGGGRSEPCCESAALRRGIAESSPASPAGGTGGGRSEPCCESAALRRGIAESSPASPAGGTGGGRSEPCCESAALRRGIHLVGFWHADFPVTYVRRIFEPVNEFLAEKLENAAWAYARHEFKNYAGIQVSSHEVMNRMSQHGLQNLHLMPLGVNVDLFSPKMRDEKLVEELKAGNPDRLTMFFPHRLCEEKGLCLLLEAYPLICERVGYEPALVFAGTGNKISLVRDAVKKWKHIRYIGFVKSIADMARWNASCELGFALSGWETFGLSILEGMASGQCLIGAGTGAAAEHIRDSGGGMSIVNRDAHALALSVFDCSRDREKMRAMSANGRTYAEKFSWGECFRRQGEFYNRLASASHSHDLRFSSAPV